MKDVKAMTYFPFDNELQWRFARWAMVPQPLPKKRIERAIKDKFLSRECCFENVNDFYDRLGQISLKGGEWMKAYAEAPEDAPEWILSRIEFYKRDTLHVLRALVGDVRLAYEMIWAPMKLFNEKGDRLYSELYCSDWWHEQQVCDAIAM